MEVLAPLAGRMSATLGRRMGQAFPGDEALARRATTGSQFDLMETAAAWIEKNGADKMKGLDPEKLPEELDEAVQSAVAQWTAAGTGDEGGNAT
jgi:hypothetical protein